jgi:hypothetical protein
VDQPPSSRRHPLEPSFVPLRNSNQLIGVNQLLPNCRMYDCRHFRQCLRFLLHNGSSTFQKGHTVRFRQHTTSELAFVRMCANPLGKALAPSRYSATDTAIFITHTRAPLHSLTPDPHSPYFTLHRTKEHPALLHLTAPLLFFPAVLRDLFGLEISRWVIQALDNLDHTRSITFWTRRLESTSTVNTVFNKLRRIRPSTPAETNRIAVSGRRNWN